MRSLDRVSTRRLSAVVARIAKAVAVLRGCGTQGDETTRGQRDREPLMRGVGIARGLAAEESEEAPRVLGNQFHQAALEGGDQQFARTHAELAVDAKPRPSRASA